MNGLQQRVVKLDALPRRIVGLLALVIGLPLLAYVTVNDLTDYSPWYALPAYDIFTWAYNIWVILSVVSFLAMIFNVRRVRTLSLVALGGFTVMFLATWQLPELHQPQPWNIQLAALTVVLGWFGVECGDTLYALSDETIPPQN